MPRLSKRGRALPAWGYCTLAALFLGHAVPTLAQDEGAALAVGEVVSEKTCRTYVLNWGREAASGASTVAANASSASAAAAGSGGSVAAAAAASSYAAFSRYSWAREWGQELVRDCEANFRGMREALEAALTASGKFTVARTAPGRDALILTARISDIGFSSAGFSRPGGAANSTDSVVASVQYTLEDANGDTVFGDLLTKTLPIGSRMATPGMISASSQSGRTVYTQMQREVALAIARDIAFQMFPPRVTAVTPGRVSLNYRSDFIPAGSVVLVQAPNGVSSIKCVVTPGAGGYATAIPDGGGNLAQVTVGSIVNIIDSDDPAANGRRFDRVDLPGN